MRVGCGIVCWVALGLEVVVWGVYIRGVIEGDIGTGIGGKEKLGGGKAEGWTRWLKPRGGVRPGMSKLSTTSSVDCALTRANPSEPDNALKRANSCDWNGAVTKAKSSERDADGALTRPNKG